MIQDKQSLLPSEVDASDLKIKVYKKRWIILLIFSINSMANALLFTSITSINKIVCKYYGISPELTDWAGNSFTLVYLLIALPSAYCMSSFGVRTLVLIGSSLNAICVCLHLAGTFRDGGIWFVMAGQFVAGFSVGAVLQVPPRLSTVWFPEKEHAKATSIAMCLNTLGLSVGFLQPSYMVPDSDDMDKVYNGMLRMNITHVAFLAVCLISAYLFFDEKPPLPPSYAKAIIDSGIEQSEHLNAPGFKESLILLFKNKNFMILTVAFGIQFGLFNFFVTCLNELSTDITSESNIGWIGFFGNIMAMISILLFSTIIDKYKSYTKVSIFLKFTTVLAWTAYSATVVYFKTTQLLYVTYLALCFFGVPFFVIGLEYTAEITYPIPEGLSSCIVLMAGNLVGLLTVLFFGKLVDQGMTRLMCCIVLGMYVIAFILICFVKPELKRSEMESNRQDRDIINGNVIG